MKYWIPAAIALSSLFCIAPAAGQETSESDSGLYLSVRAIGSNPTAKDHPTQVEFEYNYGYGATGAIGYAVANPGYGVNFRFELEASYRKYDLDEIYDPFRLFCGANVICPATGDFNVSAAAVNMYFDFNTGSRVLPSVGVGYGRARYFFHDRIVNGLNWPNFRTDTDFFQIMAGFGYKLTPGLIIDTEYRYIQPNDISMSGFLSNEITIGVRLIL